MRKGKSLESRLKLQREDFREVNQTLQQYLLELRLSRLSKMMAILSLRT